MKKELTLSEKAYSNLKNKILDLQLRPGEILMVQSLAHDLGLSRTPVREALIRLKEEGLLEEASGNKFKVSEIDLKKIIELYDMREVLEGYAVRQLAKKRTLEYIQELEMICESMRKSFKNNEVNAFFSYDKAFHCKIIDYTQNSVLKELTSIITDRTQRIRFLSWYVPKRLEETLEEHQAIINCLRNQNPSEAEKALEYHLSKVKTGVQKLFEGQNTNFVKYSFGHRSNS